MDNQKTDIVEQITKDFINIDSVEEFEELLKDFTEDPALYRVYADLLVKKNSSDEAALTYGRAAALYLKSGKLLPSVVAKLLQWRIKSPFYQDAQLFLTALNALLDSAHSIFARLNTSCAQILPSKSGCSTAMGARLVIA